MEVRRELCTPYSVVPNNGSPFSLTLPVTNSMKINFIPQPTASRDRRSLAGEPPPSSEFQLLPSSPTPNANYINRTGETEREREREREGRKGRKKSQTFLR